MDLKLAKVKRGNNSFDRCLTALDPDRDKAGEIYVALRNVAEDFFENNKCPDARGLADEVLDVLCRIVRRKRIRRLRNASGLAYRIADNIKKRTWRTMYRDLEIPENLLSPIIDSTGESISEAEPSPCEAKCLRELSQRERHILV